ncbi:hypothetical protein SLS62_000002 [Diatrype stigma]|uniref:Uncharacterized protein n=1 Tax=Diatrype stigma TaxID=117547 RepID=A0AAN9YUN1_9PEZI
MGVKDRDDVDSSLTAGASDVRPREKRTRSSRSERSKDDKDTASSSHRHHHHHKTSSRKHTSTLDGVGSHLSSSYVSSSHSHRRHRTREEKERDRDRDREQKASSMSDLVPELAKTSLPGENGSRVSLPYPSFSKAHSKESVLGRSREDLGGSGSSRRNNDPITPDATDLGSEIRRSKSSIDHSESRKTPVPKDGRPPTPPETDLSGEKRRSKTSASRLREEYEYDRPHSRTSGVSRSSSRREDDKSKLSKASSQTTYLPSIRDPPPPTREPPPPPVVVQTVNDDASYLSDDRTAGARSAATSIPPKRSISTKVPRVPSPMEADDSPESVQDSSPKTPTAATPQFPPAQVFPNEKPRQARHINIEDHERPTPSATPMTDLTSPPPPPPPPPPALNIQEVPRVDYLLQYGGLPHPAPKHFLSVVPRQNGTRPSNPPLAGAETMFAPFFNLLDQYQTVLNKQGSVAVATGHKSVARRLLDRLEDVFSRDLPAEGCNCIMCERAPEEHRGLGWGEVLERVGGRVELPPWPPFDLANLGVNAAEQAADVPPRPASPVKLDPDIAEEFRDHYLKQSKKVRSAVDKWMSNCGEAPPPSEVDDETLAFAMLTSLEEEERPYFNALLAGSNEIQPAVRAPTPMRKSRPDFLVKTGLSIQRLYRLPQAPRDAESAMHLVKNPMLHDLLSTITDISPQEWEILVSGRFDGFLWSGLEADDAVTPTVDDPLSRGATPAGRYFSPPPSRGPVTPGMNLRQTPSFSRNTTPFSGVYSRGATPASFVSASSAATGSRQPVSHDEEIEVAVLSEVEREIYQGMEALEDAFEKLHQRAETVRNALRQRNAGLSMSMQSRRAGRIDVLPQLSGGSQGYERPAWARGEDDDAFSESDWGGDDFSIAPEDSASNVASNRHRRPKRRNERRTPAPIEEDAEEN